MINRIDRVEMKFLVTAAQRAVLMERLDPHVRPDANGHDGPGYPIVSLYYDTAERDCHWEKVRGLGSRRKLRVRVYGSHDGRVPPVSFLEVKHKCDGRGVKRRVQLPIDVALGVGGGLLPDGMNLSLADMRVIGEVHDLVARRGFKPVMVMRYDRSAFASVDPAGDLRVTFDTGIFCRFDNLVPEPDDRRFHAANEMYPDGRAVMEVKITGCVPYWFSRMISEAGCRLRSHSKYSNALAQCDPVLRAMLAPKFRPPAPVRTDGAIQRVHGDRAAAPGQGGGQVLAC